MTTEQSEQSREHLQVEWLHFSLNENAQQLARNYEILPFDSQKLQKTERKVRQSLFVSVEINSTIAKVTVWHNWLNRVRLA